jgi:hypothetical protein
MWQQRRGHQGSHTSKGASTKGQPGGQLQGGTAGCTVGHSRVTTCISLYTSGGTQQGVQCNRVRLMTEQPNPCHLQSLSEHKKTEATQQPRSHIQMPDAICVYVTHLGHAIPLLQQWHDLMLHTHQEVMCTTTRPALSITPEGSRQEGKSGYSVGLHHHRSCPGGVGVDVGAVVAKSC